VTAEGCGWNGLSLSPSFPCANSPLSFLPKCAAGAEDIMQKILRSTFVLTSLSASLTAQALTSDAINPANKNQSVTLADIVVTATRSETDKNELAAATTVITRADIDALQVGSLPELLKGSTGIDIVQYGGYGQGSEIFMRGTNSDQLLVMINGIKAGSVSLGSTGFELIPVDQIERIEIIRGPQSSLYGSEAIGGVIQIFTRKGKQAQTPSISVNAGGGSYDTHQESGTISGNLDKTTYSLGASNLDSQGFKAIVNLPVGVSPNPNGYGYRNTAVNARLGQHFDDNAEIEAFFMRAEGTNQFDETFVGDTNKRTFVNQAVGITAKKTLLENWQSSLNFGQTQDDQTNFVGAAFNSLFNTSRWNASWLNQLTLNKDHKLTLGGDYRLDQLQSATQYAKNSRYDFGLFGELHSKIFSNNFINASVRWDQNQQFGDALTGNIGWRFNWQYGLSAFASFGNAFKAPTFNQLYYPNYGTASLKPETSTSVEAGVAGNHELVQWELRAYHTNIANLINTNPNPNNFSAVNIDKSQIDGLEAEIGSKLLGWQNKLNMSLLNPRNKADNSILPNRAQQTLSYDVSRSFAGFDFGAKVIGQGTRRNLSEYFDNHNPTVAGYITIDLRTAYHFDKNWMVSAKLNNLLDKSYQTVYNYSSFGRNFFVTLHYNF
jgi:vitamin B12 transporter